MATRGDKKVLVVGGLLVEPALDRISCDFETVSLRPQVMELLVFLASNEGQVASIEELLDTLWHGKVVTDGTLYNCICELRHAIASLDDTQSYIENIPKRGYRLAANVASRLSVPIADNDEAQSSVAPGGVNGPGRDTIESEISPPLLASASNTHSVSKQRFPFGATAFFVLIAGLMITMVAVFFVAAPRENRSIAVLPFEDISPGGDQAYFGNSIADELRLELQRLGGLRVAGRTSSIAYAKESSSTTLKSLNVDSIIEGSIRKSDDSVRITVQLTDVADGFTIWSKSYDRKLANLFAMQEEIAMSVAGALGVRLGVGAINAFRGAGTRNIEAYEAYVLSRSKDHNVAGSREASRLLQRAIDLDPNYAAAWSALGVRTVFTTWDVRPEQAAGIVKRAYPLVLRGVELNPESATAHSTLAEVRHRQFDWIGAEQSHLRSIELLADRPIIISYGHALMRNGRTQYAQKQFDIATTLEPLGGRPPSLAWHASLAQGRFAEAQSISDWQGAADRVENNLDIAFNQSDPEKLKAAIQAMSPSSIATVALYGPVLAEFDSPERVLAILRDVHADEDLQWIRKLHDVAMVAAYFGDPEFALLAKAQELRSTPTRLAAMWYPIMTEVRRLPGFKKLMVDLNLEQYWRAYGWADACRPHGDDDFECS